MWNLKLQSCCFAPRLPPMSSCIYGAQGHWCNDQQEQETDLSAAPLSELVLRDHIAYLTKQETWDTSARGDSAQRRDERIVNLSDDARRAGFLRTVSIGGCWVCEDSLDRAALHDQVRSRYVWELKCVESVHIFVTTLLPASEDQLESTPNLALVGSYCH